MSWWEGLGKDSRESHPRAGFPQRIQGNGASQGASFAPVLSNAPQRHYAPRTRAMKQR